MYLKKDFKSMSEVKMLHGLQTYTFEVRMLHASQILF
jgi:hypothetical protein